MSHAIPVIPDAIHPSRPVPHIRSSDANNNNNNNGSGSNSMLMLIPNNLTQHFPCLYLDPLCAQ